LAAWHFCELSALWREPLQGRTVARPSLSAGLRRASCWKTAQPQTAMTLLTNIDSSIVIRTLCAKHWKLWCDSRCNAKLLLHLARKLPPDNQAQRLQRGACLVAGAKDAPGGHWWPLGVLCTGATAMRMGVRILCIPSNGWPPAKPAIDASFAFETHCPFQV